MAKQKMNPPLRSASFVAMLLRLRRSGSRRNVGIAAVEVKLSSLKKAWKRLATGMNKCWFFRTLKKDKNKTLLILISVLVLFLRLPSLFEPFTYGDEGVYLTLGQAAKRGLVFYRDIHDNKPPLLYLLAALAGNFSTFRLILFFWSLATIFVFYRLSEILFNKNKSAIISSTAAFALLSSLHSFEGNVANAENFMLLPTITAFYLILKNSFDKHRNVKVWFLAGVLLSLATLFKVPAAFDFAALMVLLLFTLEKKNLSSVFYKFLFALLGFLLPILLSFGYYASQGALNQYLTAAFSQNIPYLSSWTSGGPQASGLSLPLLGRGLAVFSLVAVLFVFRKEISLKVRLILVWFAFSWFAAVLSSRPYPHYLIQILPALGLSFGLFFVKQKKYLKEKIIPTVLLVVFLITFLAFRFWYYLNLPYYFNFYQYVLRIKNRQEYFSDFDPRANSIYQTANYLSTHTLPEEKIFIWGNDPFIYALTRRLPVGRYTVAYHIIDFNGYQETMTSLRSEQPQYLIVDPAEKRPFPEFFNWLEQEYSFDKQIGDFQIYHRLL